MSLFQCTQAYIRDFNDSGLISSSVLEACIFSTALFEDLTSLNETSCIESVESFQTGLSYVCTYYYSSLNRSSCHQFFHRSMNKYDAHPCYTIDEEFRSLFAPSVFAPDLILFFLSLLMLLVHLYYCCGTKA